MPMLSIFVVYMNVYDSHFKNRGLRENWCSPFEKCYFISNNVDLKDFILLFQFLKNIYFYQLIILLLSKESLESGSNAEDYYLYVILQMVLALPSKKQL